MSKNYNTTQLDPLTTFERHVFHRDQFAHYLRWSHVLKRAPKKDGKILDVGCGSGNLYEVLYRNRYTPAKYVGLEYREKTVKINRIKWEDQPVEFHQFDFVKDDMSRFGNDFDIICSFETLEHCGIQNVETALLNMKKCMNENTILLLSTPCYDQSVGAADNHTYDSGDGRGVAVQEMTYDEFKSKIENVGLKIVNNWGTFASIRDYKDHLKEIPGLESIYEKLHDYFDANVLSSLMAPLFPGHSRNVMWECKL